MSKEFTVKKVVAGEKPLIDLIFVHGLTGDPLETWQCPLDGSFWPKWLMEDLSHLSIYTIGYPVSLFEKWARKEMDMFERAGNVLERLAGSGIGSRPIVFIAHSLGGVLVKMILRRATESGDVDYQRIVEATRVVIFISTPHLGASLASALSLLPGVSSHVELLANEAGYLEDLNQQYRALADKRKNLLSTVVYYEKHKTKKLAVVVSRESADPGVGGKHPTALDKDHINICKPNDREDILYLGVKRHVNNLLSSVRAALPRGGAELTGEDYTTKADDDRRDLLQKLIDAGREHEYQYANNAQNQFARRFAKSGLFTSARNDHQLLLSEVETRFTVHVYHPLICNHADDVDIRGALQAHVIDPLANKQTGGTVFAAKDIFSALYYLTEQCHIRWDAPK